MVHIKIVSFSNTIRLNLFVVSKRLRINSVSPASVNSSVPDMDYDIIRDDVGRTKLVKKMFYNSLRSNSSKYVSEASKFKSPSDYNSSKGIASARDDIFSGRDNTLFLPNSKYTQ